jgi:methyl-accepting chemotaxis protein
VAQQGRRRGFKSFIVEPYKQVKLGLMFLVVNTIFSMLILGVFGYYVVDLYSAVVAHFRLSGQENQLALAKFSIPMFAASALMLLFVVTTLILSIRYTHQIYGPLVSINRFLDELLAGQKPQLLNLRDSDQLQDLAKKLNEFAEKNASRTPDASGVSKSVQGLSRFLDEYLAGQNPKPIYWRESDYVPPEIREVANKLNTLAQRGKN